jgi:riboflavin transporter FmnP
VTADTGEISQVNDRWSRGRYYLRTLHNFQAVKLLSNRQTVITGLLWGTTIATLLTVVLGYYLALPRKWRIF